MPAYDFHCNPCDRRFEARASFDAELIPCLECGGNARRQFSVNRQIHIPLRFKAGHTISDYTPPRDHPSWANVAREGTTRARRQETFRDHLRREGVRGA